MKSGLRADLACLCVAGKNGVVRALFLLVVIAVADIAIAADRPPGEVVAELYQAHRSARDPLDHTELLSRYFHPTLLRLYLNDKREAKGEVGRLDGDPLYNAQEVEITDFKISAPQMDRGEARVTVLFKNLRKPVRVVYVLSATHEGWRINDIRYDDGSSLKRILQGPR